jgi:hypothetical protein
MDEPRTFPSSGPPAQEDIETKGYDETCPVKLSCPASLSPPICAPKAVDVVDVPEPVEPVPPVEPLPVLPELLPEPLPLPDVLEVAELPLPERHPVSKIPAMMLASSVFEPFITHFIIT